VVVPNSALSAGDEPVGGLVARGRCLDIPVAATADLDSGDPAVLLEAANREQARTSSGARC
jgi:hypothetical protein